MNSYIRSFIHAFFRGLLRFIGGLIFAVLLIIGVVWIVAKKPQRTYSAPSSAAVSKISNSELQSIIADVYHVETSRFIQPDLLWITVPAGANVQKTCQAIANLWAHRSGLDYVRVECWAGNTRLGQGTVQYGQMVNP